MRAQDWKPYAEDRQAGKKRIRGQILFVQWLFITLFAVMAAFICIYAARNRKTFFDNSYNGREARLLAENTRGKIFAADGQVLAETVTEDGGDELRRYPFGALFSHVVGYSTKGRSGIEKEENYALVHSDLPLSEKAAADEKGNKYPGNNVFTTLRPEIQQAAGDALGIYRGAVIATDPATGAILAMVSKPDFDPNEIDARWDSYLAGDGAEGRLLNRATQGMYPPGSTFKLIDTIEYLEEHPDTWKDYRYQCTGTLEKAGGTVHCFHYEVHGSVDLTDSFAESCNCSFANLGLELDRNAYEGTLEKLMFDGKLPFSYPYTESHVYLDAATPEKEVMQMAIGQGETSMSPFHLHLITQAVADGGILMRPYLVESVRTAEGSVLRQELPEPHARLMSERTAAELRRMMQAVVERGTATKLSGFSYTAAGKTGSAEYDPEDEDRSHAWFTGFAPAEEPQICVTVIIEGAGSGGDYAVPIARRVFDSYFAE